ncbi:putative ABC-type sugar transport systems,permease component [Vibrio nigripulchritudo MADA3029]|uniref:Putative ABC-type sugar transport systems, permease component n=1 Tax=Vibrio nigripulchritudo TaxID=28173 RepID=U4K7I8_9VIBR|nr:sugar ABC transporter permease [Vibrio nigripulchritudo]CCN49492.1 putative ABC-type sugar transport systems,permease component [Vibrio nigripulchritudo MADA3020]CCN51328.1 putative ABC-type sugar transport systems,permease component [Vibrio nigripulchritudo MADA3021]CCN59964.1 putative ABC-type sugar transport systems,permease component [Vibrio nigripulchritudo MADA3029]CCN81974.1 putative ABC-type sugar transport systems,permease component [Vibrio nigripulchritudo BLFn1]CCN90437.1 putativ
MNSLPVTKEVASSYQLSFIRWLGRYSFLLPAAIIFMVFIAYPIAWVFTKSVLSEGSGGIDQFVGVEHYVSVMKDPVFWTVMKNMFLWALITIPVQMLIGGTIAYFIEFYTNRWRAFFRTCFFLPVVTSVSVVSLIWVQIYAPYYGIGQEYLKMIGIQLSNSPLGDPDFAIYALIIVNIWQWTGFSMLMYIAGLTNLPREILEAARVDGAKGFRLAVSIIIPMLSSSTKSLLMLGIIGTLQTFPIVFLMTNGGPNRASEIFGTYIFKQSFVIGDLGIGAALSVMVLLIAFILSVLQIVILGSQPDGEKRGKDA